MPGADPSGGPLQQPANDPEADKTRQDYIAKQQRWLLFLRHCAKCQAPDNTCRFEESCRIAKQLWRHILTCSDGSCPYARLLFQPSKIPPNLPQHMPTTLNQSNTPL